MRHKKTLFCAADAYALIGGIQSFNRRVIRHLGEFSRSGAIACARVMLHKETPADLPKDLGVECLCAGSSHLTYVLVFLREIFSAETLLIGHIDLLPLAAAARLLRPSLPIVLFVHGDEVWNDPKHRLMRWYEPWILKSVSLIAAVSNFTIQRMSAEFKVPLARFRLFPNAVDELETVSPRETTSPVVLTVTRLGIGDREKNVDKVIRAFAMLKGRVPNAVYEIIGDGCLRPELEKLASQLGIADRVRFLGRISDCELNEALKRASLFVLPSSKEGFGIVYLEAWQRGIPVICGADGAPSEIISDGIDGFVVNSDALGALEERMYQLLTDNDLNRQFGNQGIAKVQSKYLDCHFGSRLKAILMDSGASECNICSVT